MMNDTFLNTIKALANRALKDEDIDAVELTMLKDMIVEDGSIDNNEASLIFEIQDNFVNKPYSDAFADFFVNGITSFLLYSGETPGSLDTKEWIWLLDQIAEDGHYTDLEKALLKNIAMKAENVPEDFAQTISSL